MDQVGTDKAKVLADLQNRLDEGCIDFSEITEETYDSLAMCDEKAMEEYLESEKIEEDTELIFGIQHKMTSVDPYFYYSSILRIACHDEAKLIVVIGYSYADEYVNIIISQALNMRSELRVINVAPFNISEDAEKKRIAERLKLKNLEQLIVVNATAKDFMTKTMNKDFFVKQIKEPEGSPFD